MRELPISQHPGLNEALESIRRNLVLGNEYMAGMALVVIEIVDHVPNRDAHIIQERMLKQAFVVTDRTLRTDNSERRKVPDMCFRFGSMIVACLGNVSPDNVFIPLGRVANQIRNEFYGSGDATAMRARRRVNIAVTLWNPQQGYLNEEKFVERAFDVLEMMWAGDGIPDAYDYLKMAPTALDEWSVGVADALPPRTGKGDATGPLTGDRPPRSTRAGATPTAATADTKTGVDPAPDQTRPGGPNRRPTVVTKRLHKQALEAAAREKEKEKKGWMFWK